MKLNELVLYFYLSCISLTFYQGWEKETNYGDILKRNFQQASRWLYHVWYSKADLRFKCNGLPAEDVLSRGQLKLLMCVFCG